jgi:hypothetical protein
MIFRIAIPSYNRHTLLSLHTLSTLQKYKISPSIIDIFVANKSEYNTYKKSLDPTSYNRIIIGKKGLRNQRNFIQQYYPENTNLVQMDDDIEDILELHEKTTKIDPKQRKNYQYILKPISNLNSFIQDMFQKCRSSNAFLWGIYPVANAFFMTPTISTSLKFIVGPMWGAIIRHSPDLKLELDEKEDVERTLKYFHKDGIVVRANNITVKTKYYANKGGMQSTSDDRKADALKSAEYLVKKWQQYAKLHLTKKSGHPEVKLRPTNKILSHTEKWI